MKKLFPFFLLITLIGISSCGKKDPQLSKDNIDEVLAAMTLEEKVHLIVGLDMRSDSSVWISDSVLPGLAGSTYAIPRLGIPTITLADGPAGVRITPTRDNDTNTYYCTGFPIATMLASSWDSELVEQIGTAIGDEALAYGVDVLLGPGMNLHRNPLCGRNYEYYSEDPVLSGRTAAAMVRGIQHTTTVACPKHFAVNNQETQRVNNNAIVDSRALRELYLKNFEIVVREADPKSIMTSYNLVNDVYTSEDSMLLKNILHDEWGFSGTIMTDWFAGRHPLEQVKAGNELFMPGTMKQYNDVLAAVKSGEISMETLDYCVKGVLKLIVNTPTFAGNVPTNNPDLESHALIARKAGAEAMVLLKNENNALPIANNKKVAVYGISSYNLYLGGVGSGDIVTENPVSIYTILQENHYAVDTTIGNLHSTYATKEFERITPMQNQYLPPVLPNEYVPSAKELTTAASNNDVAIITIGRKAGEYCDRRVPHDFLLSKEESQLIASVCNAFHKAGKQAIVIMNVGGVIETASWKNNPDAILFAGQGGDQGGLALFDVLSGKVNPSGKLSATYPINYMDVPSSANFPYNYMKESMRVRKAQDNTGEKERNADYTIYEEGINVGYRYFDRCPEKVSFPFGYGLSYTTFKYSDATIAQQGNTYTVKVTVTNTGSVAGKESVQLYVAAPQANDMERPLKELKAYAKTKLLNPGASETLTMTFKEEDITSFSLDLHEWVKIAGDYKVYVAASSQDIRQTLTFNVKTAKQYPVKGTMARQLKEKYE